MFRKFRSILAAGIVGLLAAGYALAQTTIPGQIGDMVYNSLLLNNNLTVAGNATITGSINGVANANTASTANPLSQFAATTSAQMRTIITDETGTGPSVFATAPTISAPTFTGTTTTAAISATTVTASGAITPTGGLAPANVTPRLIASGGAPATLTTSGNDSTPVTTETYVFEVYVPYNMTITGVALFNGSNVTGSVTVGLADSAGAPITAAKSASTAGSGTTAYQLVPFAAPYVAAGPNWYFVQVQYSSATARYRAHTVGVFGCSKQTSQTYGTLTSFTPPTTFTTNICNIASLY